VDLAVQGGFVVAYSTADGTAVQPGDYVTAGGTLTFTGTAGETHTFTVTTIDDLLVEPTETFFASLGTITNFGGGNLTIAAGGGTGTGTITDNDVATVAINSPASVVEGNPITFTVTLTGAVQSGFTIAYSTANNTAIQPGDYTTAAGTLNFAGTNGETKTFTVTTINDLLVEPIETFFASLGTITSFGGGNLSIAAGGGTGTGTITDNDVATVAINSAPSVVEGVAATFTVTLTGAVQGGFTIAYNTADNTAVAPGDYTAASNTLNFAGTNGETKTLTVTTIDDLLVEPTETFFASLGAITNFGGGNLTIAAGGGTGTGTITDNDVATVAINSPSPVAEGTGVTFTVTLTGAVQGGFTIAYNTANNTAIQPGDYTSTSGTLNFTGTNGETKTFTVTTIDDLLVEPTETFFASLGAITGFGGGNLTIAAGGGTGTGTITDNDVATVAINSPAAVVEGNPVTFTVTLTGAVQGGFTIGYSTANGSAIQPGDYTPASGSLNFTGTNGETKTFTVTTIHDGIPESVETFTASLGVITNFGGGNLSVAAGGGTGTGTINDGYQLNVKVFLQGPYNTSTDQMNTTLNAGGQLPLNQPYSVAPWLYTGTESVASFDPAVVDWVLVELRSTTTTTFMRKAALLYKDGSLAVGYDNQLAPGSTYYVVIWQRNHMPLMSASNISIPLSGAYLDLTVLANCYGTEPAIQLEGTVYGMIAGDDTRNGQLKYTGPGNDRGPILSKIFSLGGTLITSVINNGYWYEDATMNNQLKYLGSGDDRSSILANIFDLLNTNLLTAVYHSVVPGADAGLKSLASGNGPVNIHLKGSQQAVEVVLNPDELISDGVLDNVQFTLAWNADDPDVEGILDEFTSDYVIQPQGEPVDIDGIRYQVFVSVTPAYLPAFWNAGEDLTVMTFTTEQGDQIANRLWIADDGFTLQNNAMYYVSVWGNDYTGVIHPVAVSVEEPTAEGITISSYPNPLTDGKLTLELKSSEQLSMVINLYDPNGNSVISMPWKASGPAKQVISLSTLPPGAYMLSIVGEKVNYHKKLIILSLGY